VIVEQGGTVPEELPTPAESIQQLEARERRRLERLQARQAQLEAGQQLLFGGSEGKDN
jgi:BMFP domain-containing protein YqiC